LVGGSGNRHPGQDLGGLLARFERAILPHRDAMMQWPAEFREVIVLHDLNGLLYREIAHLPGIGSETGTGKRFSRR
jgi:DNA-directed RNA polymerase specialized sigma24 family protein